MAGLYVTCDCTRKTEVTPAKCGGVIRCCMCGKDVNVPPLSVLRSAANAVPSGHSESVNELQVEIEKFERNLGLARLGMAVLFAMMMWRFLAGEYLTILYGPILLIAAAFYDRMLVRKLENKKKQLHS